MEQVEYEHLSIYTFSSKMHLSETECPENCDREMYDTAFSMRKKRHQYLNSIHDIAKEIELIFDKHKIKSVELMDIESERVKYKNELNNLMVRDF